ncbi:dienelactone hydrolase family protein [Cnuibacter physcomitrellae]|uniref:dienelactone hydrolase family protein n=1 Tax=Cnuibacter physcomitrellae TaxID=1619308 RepID=UPI002877E23B|nr:alpha/beta hydrolase [Cnuibacter physcomitrellae]
MTLQILSERRLDGDLLERSLLVGDVPGILWMPPLDPSGSAPLILLGHPGGLDAQHPRLIARARRSAQDGFASAALELPGSGSRPRLSALEEARAELRTALGAREPVADATVDRLVLPLVDAAVPECRAALDALSALPGLGGPVGYSGGIISLGVRLALADPRIAAAVLFAGSWIPKVILEEARAVRIPIHMLLQWDDVDNPRQAALDLFDAFGSPEKSLAANLGGHTGVPAYAGEEAARFLARHLGVASSRAA